jgi:hypothetical protein
MSSTLLKRFAAVFAFVIGVVGLRTAVSDCRAELLAGVAKVDVTDRKVGPVNDPLFVKALVLKNGDVTAVLVTVDAVAIGEIGPIKNDYLPTVRRRLEQELGIKPTSVLINASHCHGVVVADVADRTVEAVRTAAADLVPVRVGVGAGHEDRIMENRRLKLKSGREVDVRHAYSLPPDEEVAAVGPVDPEIGVLRLDRADVGAEGRALAVVYNFACHPIQGVPGGGNTADLTGFASQTIEDNLGEGTMALFVQGCGGDINPIDYKDVDHPRHGEPLGTRLGLSTLAAVRKIACTDDDRLVIRNETLTLPRGDRTERIFSLEAEQKRLLASLKGTSLNVKTFIPLYVKYELAGDFPSAASHRYLHDKALGHEQLALHDAANRKNLKLYLENIRIMEELTRVQTNLALLKKHQASLVASGKRTVDVEVAALRVGEFTLVTFPGELTVEIGLGIKSRAPHKRAFVAGYTNGYIYYAPTAEQMRNVGGAQEDSDCILAPEWQKLFEDRAASLLDRL